MNAQKLKDFFPKIIKNAIEFEIDESATKPLPIGASKLGGLPHLPASFEWPYYEGTTYEGERANRPMTFVAQMNLRELAPLDKDGLLPHTGMLYFFYEMTSAPWGEEPQDFGSAKVYWIDAPEAELTATPFPADLTEPHYCFAEDEQGLTFKAVPSLPNLEEFLELYGDEFDMDDNDDEEDDSYYDALESFGVTGDDYPETKKLLGYADLFQDSMLGDCERVLSGLSPQNLTKEQIRQIEEGQKDWILLAQFIELWGSTGFYYYIRKQDLARRDFSKVHMIQQVD